MIERATATVFHRFVKGRTSPAIFSCVREGSAEQEEYFVKLKGGIELGTEGLVCESVASVLAAYFQISHPRPALVDLDIDFVRLVSEQEPTKAALMMNSVGTNFGTLALNNLITWPVDRRPSASQFDSATDIFAFDVLIQNPDRRYNNPNLGTVGDQLYIYDHELAFSFRFNVIPIREPWKLADQKLWNDHVFFNSLKRKALSLEHFVGRLSAMPPNILDDLEESLPSDWTREMFPTINTYLRALADHADEFKEEIVQRLI